MNERPGWLEEYRQQLEEEEAWYDRKIADIDTRRFSGEITPAAALAERVEVMQVHLTHVRALRAKYLPG